ncbi:MAG: TVP38/TMEM64 family protein [Alphaproteobacteria bacterium]|nr:TVP38/TMEM64 family protein [Alphaproteobacteria bacterium]
MSAGQGDQETTPMTMDLEPFGEKKQRMARLRAILKGRDKESLRNIGLLIFTVITVSLGFWLTANIIGLDENGILARTFKSFAGSPWALPVVALGYTAASFIGAPQFLLFAITVAAFGPLYGFAYSVAATLISAAVNFLMARYLGADWLRRRGWQGIGSLSDMVGRNGFMSSLLVRIIPSAPFIVVNMGLGLTRTSFAAFMGGTAIGILPKAALIALLGKVLERAQAGDIEAIEYLILATLGWIALAFLAKWIVRRREAHKAGAQVQP